jgi:membrane-associated phospholipid phosphatase
MRLHGKESGKSAILRITLGFTLAAVILAGLGLLVTGPYKEFPASFDASIRYAIRQMQSPMWTALFLVMTKLGSTIYLTIVGCLVGIAFLVLRWFRPFLLLIITMAGQAVLHNGFKLLIARPRPPAMINYAPIETFSFPSGHAIGVLCLYFVIAWTIATRATENAAIKTLIGISAAILIFLVGVSRLYIGIHYPTDVLAGFLGGFVWTLSVLSTDRRPL